MKKYSFKTFRLLKRLISFIGIIAVCAFAQPENTPKEYFSELYSEAFAFKSDSSGKGRMDVYVQIPYSEINFIKDKETYTGRIELSVSAADQAKHEIWQNSQAFELNVKDFSQTASQKYSSIKKFSADLPPGKYDLTIQIKDIESKKISAIHRQILIRDFGIDSLSISDLMLVFKIDTNGSQKNITPNLTGVILKESKSFYFFFEMYSKPLIDSVQMKCTFYDQKKEIILKRTRTEFLTGDRNQILWKIDTPAFTPDKYFFFIEATGYSKANPAITAHASTSRTCFIRMKNLPLGVIDIDKAADQLQYFAAERDISNIKSAPTKEEKLKRFLEFWAKHSLDPKSPQNDLMEEYYSRVDFANRNFSRGSEGWRTDRGMIFIRFGPPQNIDRQPYPSNSRPYEIWYYYNQNRKFIFIDETGFGDYRLQYFGSSSWDTIR